MTRAAMSEEDAERLRALVIAQGLILDALIAELVETRVVPAASLAMRLGRIAAEQANLLPEIGNILRQRRRELLIGTTLARRSRSHNGSGAAD